MYIIKRAPLNHFLKDESGSTFIEFTTVLSVICGISTFVVWIYGQNVMAAGCSFGNAMNSVTASAPGTCAPNGANPGTAGNATRS